MQNIICVWWEPGVYGRMLSLELCNDRERWDGAVVRGGIKRDGIHGDLWLIHWRRKWQPTPVFLPGESQGRGSHRVQNIIGVWWEPAVYHRMLNLELCNDRERWDGEVVRGRIKRDGIDVDLWLIHTVVLQKPVQHYEQLSSNYKV